MFRKGVLFPVDFLHDWALVCLRGKFSGKTLVNSHAGSRLYHLLKFLSSCFKIANIVGTAIRVRINSGSMYVPL